MGKIKRTLTAAICVALPRSWKPPLLRLLGHRVANGARISASILFVDKIYMDKGSSIGPLNYLSVQRLLLRTGGRIGYMNVIKRRSTGNFSICLRKDAFVGARNVILTGHILSGHMPVQLRLGRSAVVTSGHYITVDESVLIGNNAVIAGIGSQLWTHGFVHMDKSLQRAEVRGKIIIGENVYLGSHSCVGPGIRIADHVAVGAHSSVATSLLKPGVYVSQPLRHIATSAEDRLAKLQPIENWEAAGPMYWREVG